MVPYMLLEKMNAIFHSHTPDNVAGSQVNGLSSISQWGLLFYERFGFHDYDSLALHSDLQGARIVEDLGVNPILLMRNHGVVVAGGNIAETFYMHYHLNGL